MKNSTVKKITAVMLSGILGMTMLAGCGDSGSSTSSTSSASSTSSTSETSAADASSTSSTSQEGDTDYEIKDGNFSLEECVKIPEYKGLELTKTVYTYDDYVKYYIISLAETSEATDENTTVEKGYTVNIAYEGKIDGETFDGGSSDSYDLMIGSHSFIDGFEDGLVGMKKGEETDLNLKFPDDYSSTDVAGKDVVFHVTINSISVPETQDDAWVESYTDGEYTTMDDYREYLSNTVKESLESSSESALKNEAWSAVYNETDFIILPQSYIDQGGELFVSNVESQAETYGYSSVDEYYEAAGVSEDDVEEYKQEYAESYAKSRLMAEAVLDAEGIATDGDEINAMYDQLAQDNNMTLDELKEQYTEAYVYLYAVCTTVNDKLIEYANVTEKTEEYNG